jgi:hypothetical protein
MPAGSSGGPVFPGGGSGSEGLPPEYAQSLGRVSGPLLAANLEFQGQDIQFDTDLLYIDVANNRIGINNYGTSPETLYLGNVTGDQLLLSTNLIVDSVTTTNSNWTISSNTIQLASGTLYVTPNQSSNPTIIANGVGSANVNITDRLLATKNINESLYLTPDNIGIVQVTGNMQVNGVSSLTYVTGNVTVDGNYIAGSVINLGDATSDTITFTADGNSNLVPSVNDTYSIGSATKYWNNLYGTTLSGTGVLATTAVLGGINLTGNTISSANNTLDITFTPLGSGNVTFNGLVPFTGSNLNNNTTRIYNAPYYLLSTNDGYVNFAGNNAIAFPIGNSAQRDTAILGTTRFNTDLGFLEIYNGTTWQNSLGSVPLATATDVSDSAIIYDLILG